MGQLVTVEQQAMESPTAPMTRMGREKWADLRATSEFACSQFAVGLARCVECCRSLRSTLGEPTGER